MTLGGKEVTKGDFGGDTVPKSYLFVRDGLVYDIETGDEKFATMPWPRCPNQALVRSRRPPASPAAGLVRASVRVPGAGARPQRAERSGCGACGSGRATAAGSGVT